jgi:hypothetical protein
MRFSVYQEFASSYNLCHCGVSREVGITTDSHLFRGIRAVALPSVIVDPNRSLERILNQNWRSRPELMSEQA